MHAYPASEGEISRPVTPEPGATTAASEVRTVEEAAADVRKSLKSIAKGPRIKKYTEKEGNYKYAPIEYNTQLRVLRIFPGASGQRDLVGVLKSAAMFDTRGRLLQSQEQLPCIPYCALSYWWGEDKASKKIWLINEKDDALQKQLLAAASARNKGTNVASVLNAWTSTDSIKHMYIRKNLDSALRHLRSEEAVVDVWCDALCINQDDLLFEKPAQIKRMHEVYVNAQTVCIWLGAWLTPDEPEDKDKEAAIQKAERAFEFLERMLDLDELDKLVHDPSQVENWWSIYALMKKEWFGRRWIIQELALATDARVRLGKQDVEWDRFADAISLFIHKWDQLKSVLESTTRSISGDPDRDIKALDVSELGANILVTTTSDLFRRSAQGRIQQRLLSLEVLVTSILLPFQASNPKDTIFAVLSLARDTATSVPDLVLRQSWEREREVTSSMITRCVNIILGPWSPWCVKSSLQHPTKMDPRVAPNYGKPLQDIFSGFMDYCIAESGSLDILCRHWVPKAPDLTDKQRLDLIKPPDLTMPSWLASIEGHAFGHPRGSAARPRTHADSLVGGSDRRNQYYNASYGSKADVKFGIVSEVANEAEDKTYDDHDVTIPNGKKVATPTDTEVTTPNLTDPIEVPRVYNGILAVCGFELSHIIEITGPVSGGIIPAEGLQMGGWPTDDTEGDKVLPEGLWRTLVADRGPDGTSAPKWYRRACKRSLVWKDNRFRNGLSDGDLHTGDLMTMSDTPDVVIKFLDRVRRVVWKRKFFRTKSPFRGESLFGLAPEKARLDDVVCILLGCTVPVVLRKVKDSGTYTFVGECYVHGMMDGEAATLRADPRRMRYFELK